MGLENTVVMADSPEGVGRQLQSTMVAGGREVAGTDMHASMVNTKLVQRNNSINMAQRPLVQKPLMKCELVQDKVAGGQGKETLGKSLSTAESLDSGAGSLGEHLAIGIQHLFIGIQHLAIGIKHLIIGIQHLAIGIQHLAIGIQHLAGIQHLVIGMQHLANSIQHLAIGIQHLIIGIQHLAIGTQHQP